MDYPHEPVHYGKTMAKQHSPRFLAIVEAARNEISECSAAELTALVEEGAVVIDVGITRVDDDSRERGFYLQGDVDFEDVKDKTSFITPVPGGVGPMTIASLMMNTYKAAKTNRGLN